MSLTTLFTDIADAIREKDGTQEDIVASTFPERIRAIPTGGGTVRLLRTLTITEPVESVWLDWNNDWNDFNLFLVVPDVELSEATWLYISISGRFANYFGPTSPGYTHCTPKMSGALKIFDEKMSLLNFGNTIAEIPISSLTYFEFYTYQREASILSGSIALYGIKM